MVCSSNQLYLHRTFLVLNSGDDSTTVVKSEAPLRQHAAHLWLISPLISRLLKCLFSNQTRNEYGGGPLNAGDGLTLVKK
jgi:hypothetical protein